MTNKNYCIVSGVIFFLVALAHLVRIIYDMPVNVGSMAVPMLVSWVGLFVTAFLASWALRNVRTSGTA